MMRSSTAVTVTVCGVLQFAVVNTSEVVSTVPSVVSRLDIGILTLPVGALVSETVNVALVVPTSFINPEIPETFTPGSSLNI